jgi:arginine-tRNA-protein transferase
MPAMAVPDDAPGDGAPARHPVVDWLTHSPLRPLLPRPCPYLPGLVARERAFRAERLDGDGYHALMDRGFRRTGDVFYAMDCAGCRRCVPLRVPVATFAPSRSQRRARRRNADVTMTVRPPQCCEATFALYQRYLAAQHPTSAADADYAGFRASLYAEVVDTVEAVYELAGRTVAISLLDVCAQSVSAVYHFYDPDFADRSLGVHSVLAEIDWTRQIGAPHYYLGFWVEGAATMDYKAAYRPHELLVDGVWRPA